MESRDDAHGAGGDTGDDVGEMGKEDGGVKGRNGSVGGGVNLEEALLKAIIEHPGSNAPALSKLVQKSLRSVQRHLKSAHRQG